MTIESMLWNKGWKYCIAPKVSGLERTWILDQSLENILV